MIPPGGKVRMIGPDREQERDGISVRMGIPTGIPGTMETVETEEARR